MSYSHLITIQYFVGYNQLITISNNLWVTIISLQYLIICWLESTHYNPKICELQSTCYNAIICWLQLLD